jgi:hypothetical protein
VPYFYITKESVTPTVFNTVTSDRLAIYTSDEPRESEIIDLMELLLGSQNSITSGSGGTILNTDSSEVLKMLDNYNSIARVTVNAQGQALPVKTAVRVNKVYATFKPVATDVNVDAFDSTIKLSIAHKVDEYGYKVTATEIEVPYVHIGKMSDRTDSLPFVNERDRVALPEPNEGVLKLAPTARTVSLKLDAANNELGVMPGFAETLLRTHILIPNKVVLSYLAGDYNGHIPVGRALQGIQRQDFQVRSAEGQCLRKALYMSGYHSETFTVHTQIAHREYGSVFV